MPRQKSFVRTSSSSEAAANINSSRSPRPDGIPAGVTKQLRRYQSALSLKDRLNVVLPGEELPLPKDSGAMLFFPELREEIKKLMKIFWAQATAES